MKVGSTTDGGTQLMEMLRASQQSQLDLAKKALRIAMQDKSLESQRMVRDAFGLNGRLDIQV
jgi:hypothetical protein